MSTQTIVRSRLMQAMQEQERRSQVKAALFAVDRKCGRCGREMVTEAGHETSAVLRVDELLCQDCSDGKPIKEERLERPKRPSTWRLIEAIVRQPENDINEKGHRWDKCPYCGRRVPMRLACPNHMAKVLRGIGVEIR